MENYYLRVTADRITSVNQRLLKPSLIRFIFLAAMLAIMLLLAGCGDGVSSTDSPATQVSTATTATSGIQPLYVFAVCGDNRTMGIESGVLPRIVESAKARGASFMVNTGDVTGSGDIEELIIYRDFIEESGMRFYTAPGNHDVGSGGVSQDYEEILGPFYFSFDYAGDHFIILDNADDRTGIDADQMSWLSSDSIQRSSSETTS